MAVASPLRTRRYISYSGSVLVSLSSGTGYAFGLIASPIAERLGLSATSINFVGAAGNWGMYLFGPVSGYAVDRWGPKGPLLFAAVCMFSGFYGLNRAYNDDDRSASILLLAFYLCLTGVGSCAGFNAALNAAAKNFPASRGTATAFPVAALGLCAFMYGTIAKVAVPGDTGGFLLILAVMTGVSEFVGFLAIRNFPMQSTGKPVRRPFNRYKSGDALLANEAHVRQDRSSDEDVRGSSWDGQASDLPTSVHSKPSDSSTSRSALRQPDFWILAVIMLMLSGCGLMYINNVGHCVDALFDDTGSSHDHSRELSKIQAAHVSIISLSSCVGRIAAGTSSDIMVKRYGLQRTWCLVCASFVAILAQLSGWLISSLDLLYVVSCLSGFAYGLLFGCAPVIATELFGLEFNAWSFSQNWGWITLTPAFSSTLFNIVYGRIYDSHSSMVYNRCHQGQACYAPAFVFTFVAAVIAMVFSLQLHKRLQARLPFSD